MKRRVLYIMLILYLDCALVMLFDVLVGVSLGVQLKKKGDKLDMKKKKRKKIRIYNTNYSNALFIFSWCFSKSAGTFVGVFIPNRNGDSGKSSLIL